MKNLSGEISGQVAIGMAYTALQAIGKQRMRIVLEDYPGLSLVLSETLSGSTITQLMDAHIDLSLAYNPTQDARVKATPLLEERMICIERKSRRLNSSHECAPRKQSSASKKLTHIYKIA